MEGDEQNASKWHSNCRRVCPRKIYDSKSGDTTIKETLYQEDYATFFKRDPEHKGMLLMISPEDGRVEAIVEVCEKKK